MSLLIGSKLNKIFDDGRIGMLFKCPGCGCAHLVYVGDVKKPNWTWNGDGDKPTFSPSVDVNKSHPAKHCHSFVREGMITFLLDSFHSLAGKTVELPDWGSV